MEFDYDLFVIGAGSGGIAASRRAASYGARVAIAEANDLGGTCVNRGCIPKKLMVYASEFAHSFQDAVAYGWSETQPTFNWQQLIAAKDKELQRLNLVYQRMLQEAGVEVLQGYAHFLDPHTIAVADRTITAAKILIAVGGHPNKPQVPGAEYTITSDEIFELAEQPQRIVIIGGGYIGVEFAGIFQGLGSQVTLVIRGNRILKGFDEDLCAQVQEGMGHHGIQILANTSATGFERTAEGIKVSLSGDHGDPMTADVVLAATGRNPNTRNLRLDKAGVELVTELSVREAHEDLGIAETGGYDLDMENDDRPCAIAVNEYSQTTQPHIYAVGDCTDRINLTPVAIQEGRAFADTEFGGNRRIMSHECVPSAVFSQPEAATVGLSEAQARHQLGDNVKIYRARFRPLFHTVTGAEEKVLVKLVVDSNTERVLGAHMVGKGAAEIIQGVAIAVKMGATKKDFDATVGIHPTSAEEFVTLR
jgi:glutathione reductase (NADPH)